MKTCFSEGKMMKQFGTRPPFQLTPRISDQFFHDPPLCPNFKNEKPPSPNFTGGGGLCYDPVFKSLLDFQ